MAQIVCYRCQNSWEFTPPLARSETCSQCNWDSRCCKNCSFYDRGAYRECREPQAEFVADKEKNNFCSYFNANSIVRDGDSDADLAKKKLDSLFGGTANNTKDSSTLSSLADEFKKFTSKK